MPKRSTPFQAIVRLVRQHFAGPGVTVTESKLLHDALLGMDREVDVVIEGQFDGEPMTLSVEVIERGRPAPVNWVQEMLRKHRDLPTNRLLLVSQSGFTKSAITAVEREAGRVQALTPEIIEVDGRPVVKRLYVDVISCKPTGCRINFRTQGSSQFLTGEPLVDIYTEDGTCIGPLSALVAEVLQLRQIGELISVQAHNHPEREDITAFTIGLAMPQLGYHIMRSDTRELFLIESLEIEGDCTWGQTEVPLMLNRLGERVYGAGEAPFSGTPAIWVGTTDVASSTTKISWQSKEMGQVGQTLHLPESERGMMFPGLLSWVPSRVSASNSGARDEVSSQAGNLWFVAPDGRHDE